MAKADKERTSKKTSSKKTITAEDALISILPDVVFEGWHDTLFDLMVKKGNVPRRDIDALFPNGLTDLAITFSNWADQAMLARATEKVLKPMKIRERIAYGVKARLEALAPYKEAVHQSVKYMSLPPRSFKTPKMIWRSADKLWWAAGDTSTDYNHYTKRFLLAGIFTTVTLYWLKDTSKGYTKTWDFLDKRIAQVLKMGQKLSSFKPAAKSSS